MTQLFKFGSLVFPKQLPDDVVFECRNCGDLFTREGGVVIWGLAVSFAECRGCCQHYLDDPEHIFDDNDFKVGGTDGDDD